MSQDRDDDFGDLHQVSPSIHDEPDDNGYPQEHEDDGEAEQPKRRKSSSKSSSGGGLMRTVVPIAAIVGVLGGGWFGWNYYSSTHMTPPPQQHRNAFPVRKTGPDAQVASPQTAQNNTPQMNGVANNANALNLAPIQPNQQVAPQPPQRQNMTLPPAGNTLPINDDQAPLHAPATDDVPPGFPSSSPLKVPAQPLITQPGAQTQTPAPSPQKAITSDMSDMFDSKMASFLSDVKEGHESIKDTIKDTSEKAVSQIEAKVDQIGSQVTVQIVELTKKTEELSKQVDAMSHPVVEDKGKVASTTGNLHKPKTIIHRNKTVKAKKPVVQDTVMNNGSWHLRGVSRELIVLQDPKGNYMPVKIGSNVSGLGTIEGVEQTSGGKYIVKTSTSTIQE